MQNIMPSKDILDQAWWQILLGNTNGVLVILLAVLIILIFIGVRMVKKKDETILRLHDEQVTLTVKATVEIERSNERSQRILEMLNSLTGGGEAA